MKLLRVLQDKEVTRVGGTTTKKIDIRIIAATNKPIEEMVRKKEFRGDLYFRLSVIPLRLPALRERDNDLNILLYQSLARLNRLMNKGIRGFTPEALSALKSYSWPGNIREVENTVEYCVNIEKDDMIQSSSLPERIIARRSNSLQARDSGMEMVHSEQSGTLKEQLSQAERLIIQRTLEKTGSDREGKKDAARLLGVGESSLYRKIKELNI